MNTLQFRSLHSKSSSSPASSLPPLTRVYSCNGQKLYLHDPFEPQSSPYSCPLKAQQMWVELNCILSASTPVGVMWSEIPKNRSNSWKPLNAGISSGATFGFFLFFFFPLRGAPVLCSCYISLLPACQMSRTKMRLGDYSHLYFSKANRTDALSNGAPLLGAGEMYPKGGSFPTKS